MPRKQKLYHYIYKTTCQVTGKFYVGMHSTDDPNDGYLGSGKILGYSVTKHGRENHKKEIIEMCTSREELKLREREIVNEQLLADPLNINLKYGGEGGWEFVNSSGKNISGFVRDDAYKAKISKSRRGIKPNLSDEARLKMSENNPMKRKDVAAKLAATLTGRTLSADHKKHLSEANKNKAASIETKQKMRMAAKARLPRKQTEETKEKLRQVALRRWKNTQGIHGIHGV